MSLIKKSVPSDEIIKILTDEIKTFALPFAKNIPASNVTKHAFDKFKNAIPKTTDNTKASTFYGNHDMKRTEEPFIKDVMKLLGAYECTNTMYYAPNSCIDWHTNSDNEGTRIYVLYTNKPGIFRYRNAQTGEIIDDVDYVGWTQREFKVDKTNLLWHCVYSPSARFAYGFNAK